ncbi:hypothetical protein AGMMS49928_25740 [Spirochaetia bacterium]|nr:hypothetical protein AGMMS49928_25740 [Spirochaetia bacterium]
MTEQEEKEFERLRRGFSALTREHKQLALAVTKQLLPLQGTVPASPPLKENDDPRSFLLR